jgi:hypothetical protein
MTHFSRASLAARRLFPNAAIVLLVLLAAAAANVAAFGYELFERISWIDKALHAFTAFAAALALLFVLWNRLDRWLARFPALAVVTAASFGLAIGLAWETGEWLLDRIYASNLVKGKSDTFMDLLMDVLGAALAGALAMPSYRRRTLRRGRT